MPGTRPGMTSFATKRHFISCFLSQTLRMRSVSFTGSKGAIQYSEASVIV
jgi:hypothetical protein